VPPIAIAAPEGAAGLEGPTPGRVMYRGVTKIFENSLAENPKSRYSDFCHD
jgi:hypothetical protein